MPDTQPPAVPAAGGVWRALIPERTVEDVLAGRLAMHFADSTFVLPVLVIEKADEWRAELMGQFGEVVGQLQSETNTAGVFAFLTTHTPTMMSLIRSYDVSGALPDDAWLRGHATEPEILRAFMLVVAASFPFVAAALDILASNPDALKLVLQEFGTPTPIPAGSPSTTLPEPTAGLSPRSARRSRTSNSRAT